MTDTELNEFYDSLYALTPNFWSDEEFTQLATSQTNSFISEGYITNTSVLDDWISKNL
jgi:hypothetical protein